MGDVVILQFSIISGQLHWKDELKIIGGFNRYSKFRFRHIFWKSQKTLLQTQNGKYRIKKISFLAGALSFGNSRSRWFLRRNYLKNSSFWCSEAAAVAVAVIYIIRESIKQLFQNFSAQHWSVYRYADWTLNNIKTLNPNLNPANYSGYSTPKTQTVNWTILINLENDVAGNGRRFRQFLFSPIICFWNRIILWETGKIFSIMSVGMILENQTKVITWTRRIQYDPREGI